MHDGCQTLQTKNARWNVFEQGLGPAVLFVHGFPLDHTMWVSQLQSVAKTHRVIAPDLPGFGGSTRLRSDLSGADDPAFTMEEAADDLADLLDLMGVDRVCFCGLSMGGYIGWQFWKRHRARLSSLVACDTRALADTPEVRHARSVMARAALQKGSPFVAEAMLPKLFGQSAMNHHQPILKSTLEVMATTQPESIAAGHLGMAIRESAFSWLPKIDVPVLVVVGQQDGITTPREMQQVAQQIRGSLFIELADAGHMAPLEQPNFFNQHLLSFLEKN